MTASDWMRPIARCTSSDKILDAQTDPAEAETLEQFHLSGGGSSRVTLDTDTGILGDLEMLMDNLHQADQLRITQVVGRSTPDMELAYLATLAEGGDDQVHFPFQGIQVIIYLLGIMGDISVAGAEVAAHRAEGDMEVEGQGLIATEADVTERPGVLIGPDPIDLDLHLPRGGMADRGAQIPVKQAGRNLVEDG
jgi:hypothetical protein